MLHYETGQIQAFCDEFWETSIIPELTAYMRIPNKSPMFDRDWESNGYMDKAVTQLANWCEGQQIDGLQLEVIRLPGRTPLIYIEIAGNSDDTILLYGHLDKQPEMTGWRDGLGPWQPVLEGEKLYGRGGADDGYATFASLLAIRALQEQKLHHSRCVIIIEACEESGSYDLPHYIEHLSNRIGEPGLIICLDSGCGNYEQLWSTTSLRGLIGGTLKIEIMEEGVHSGDASGIIPSSFRILRQLLDRIEDAKTGEILVEEFHAEIPEKCIGQARQAAATLGDAAFERFPVKPGMQTVSHDIAELILNRSWRPTLSYTGIQGVPDIESAGNVLRPETAIKLSMRLPPGCNAEQASNKLQELLTIDPPYGATISFTPDCAANGWLAPAMTPWLERAINEASKHYFNRPAAHIGEGLSIPFMWMLGDKFPDAQFLITGVLGPGSNAHGPNEFLHISMAKKLTCCIAEIIANHYSHFNKAA